MRFAKSLTALFLVIASGVANAEFQEDLLKRFPNTVGAKVDRAFPGFWSVVKGNEVLFISDDLGTLINGEVVDLKSNRSITAALRDANRPKVDVINLPLSDAIKIGTGSRKLYIFSDPDCPYCKQLERELTKVQDLQVFIFPFPLTALHPNAEAVAQSIWCSPKPAEAWRGYLLNGTPPVESSCPTPISRNLALGARYQIQGTPAIVFPDGTVVAGAIPADRIEAQIQASAK